MSSVLAPQTRRSRQDRAPLRRPASPVVRAWWGEAGMILTWSSLLLVSCLWLLGGGLTGITSLAGALRSIGRLSGLLGSDLMLVQVLLMARIPVVERSFGQDRLAAVHRLVGFTSFTLVMVHVATIVGGYARGQLDAVWPTLVRVVTDMPAMVLAAIGLAFLILVVASSMKLARRRLRYESWHLLHLYAYLSCFLALPHQLWAGKDFLTNAAATVYWWTAWALAAGAVLVYRLGLPVARNLRHRVTVADVSTAPTATGAVVTVTMTGRELHRLKVAGGQFFQWRFLDGPGWTRAHPFSLSAAPDGRSLQISAQVVGDGTARLERVTPGTRVLLEGPYGRMHAGVRTRRKVLLLAAGIGIAPMKAILEAMDQAPGDVVLIYRTSQVEGAALLPELAESARARGARVVLLDGHRVTSRPSWLPESWGHLDDVSALRHLVPDVRQRDVFVCGGPLWMTAAETAVREAGVPAGRIHLERFSY